MPKWTPEQQEAIEKSGSNIIVSAGAGSGKTAVLSERVIHKLNSGIHVDELLILTFTRAAAEEMKDRIRKKIAKEESLKDELDKLDSAYITTFDSFALSVVKKYHYLIGVKKDIEITDESIVAIQKKKILDEVFDEKYLERSKSFVEFVKTYALKNDRELKKKIMSLVDKIDGFLDRDGFLEYLEMGFYSDESIDSLIEKFKSLVEEKKKVLELELDRARSYFDADYIASLEGVILPLLNSKSLDELWSKISVTLPRVKNGTEEEAKKIKADLKVALDDLLGLKEFGNEKNIKSDILSSRKTADEIIDIIKRYYTKIHIFKESHDIYTFSDIASKAIYILENFEEAKDELSHKFKEIMIDEYQDTNDIQEKFVSLIAHDNVYMVGDIKQSIYRFRGSNPDIFKSKYDRYSNGDGGLKIDLIKNFRSREEVLDNINRIFDLIMDDALGGAAYTVSHEMIFGNEDYKVKKIEDANYNLEVLEYEKETNEFSDIEIEIFAVASDIEKKIKSNYQVYDKETGNMRPFKYSDAVIILDRSKYFDTFKKVFEYKNIPLTILKDDKLNTSVDMSLVKNLLDLVLSIKDKDYDQEFKYSFMSIGRSFLYEYTDEYLFDVISTGSFDRTPLYSDISSISDIDSKSIKEIILELLDVTHFYDKLYKVGDYENVNIRINKILELSSSLGAMGYTLLEFKDYLDEIIESDLEIKYTASEEDVDSVKILTIHKSKGLEYPVCYFADLPHAFNTVELKSKFIIDKTYGLILPVTDDFKESDSALKTLYKNDFMKSEIGEKIRLFYVALTRAREKMIILLPAKDTDKLEKNRDGVIDETRRIKWKSLGDMIYGVKEYLPSYFKKLDLNEIGISKAYLYSKVREKDDGVETNDKVVVEELMIPYETKEKKIFSEASVELLNEATIDNMHMGTKVHEILEYIDFNNFDPNSIEEEFIRRKVEAFLKTELLADLSDANIYHEYEFIYEKEDVTYHGSIDLMMEHTDHIDIIDYKLKNTKNAHYLEQLRGYKEYIESVSGKKVFTYLYSIIDESLEKLN